MSSYRRRETGRIWPASGSTLAETKLSPATNRMGLVGLAAMVVALGMFLPNVLRAAEQFLLAFFYTLTDIIHHVNVP